MSAYRELLLFDRFMTFFRFSFLSLLLVSTVSNAQITGGQEVYKFLTLPPSARIAAMGGLNLSTYDADVTYFLQNPALLNAQQNGRLHLQQNFYLVGTNQLTAAYGRDINKVGWVGASVQYVNYGEMDITNTNGLVEGTDKSYDMAISLGAARPITNRLNYGVTAKYVRSNYMSFTGEGFMADVGFSYVDTASGFVASLVGKNIGTTVNSFTAGIDEELPFDIQLGLSKRLENTPFLFSLNLHHLHQWDIRYDDPALQVNDAFLTDTATKEKSHTVDKAFRHAVFGTEIYLGKNLRANLGYNHLRRAELAFEERKTLSGFSFGLQLAFKKFGVSYAYSIYNAAVSSNHFSLYLNTTELLPSKHKSRRFTPSI